MTTTTVLIQWNLDYQTGNVQKSTVQKINEKKKFSALTFGSAFRLFKFYCNSM